MSILTRVQANPEIGTNDAAYVADLIARVKRWIEKECRLPRFPELLQGYAKTGESAGTDLSALTTTHFYLSLNGSTYEDVEPTLASCTDGDTTAAELQATIRAIDQDGFDEVTVAYADTQYTITSGRYGEASTVRITFEESTKHVCQSLKLSPAFGGTQKSGSAYNEHAEDLAVQLVEILYRRVGAEGAQSVSVADGDSITAGDLPRDMQLSLSGLRRLF